MPAEGPKALEAGCNLVRFAGIGTPEVEGSPPMAFRDLYNLDHEPLGEGRYSRVYAATHRITGARRAVKTAMRKGSSHTIQDLGMECPARLAMHEASILKTFDHPNIIRLHAVHEEQSQVHLVLELCEGSDVLERILATAGRLQEADIANVFVQMLAGVWHIHAHGSAHRDLKPEHFLFTRREPDRMPAPPWRAAVKIIDLGLGHLEGVSFRPGGGTPQFMPPEAITGGKIIDVKSLAIAQAGDMWSMGVVLHAMMVGHYPSPKLTDKAMGAYLKKPAWKAFSEDCLDMMASLLRQQPGDRLTCAAAIKHPWAVSALKARGASPACLELELPKLVTQHAVSPGLLRLALRVVAREVDDFDLFEVRTFFQSLLVGCGGLPTADTLKEYAASGESLGQVALALSKEFETLHGNGKGGITWSEFVAVVLASTHLSQSKLSELTAPLIKEETIWRAFDLMRYDTQSVSGNTLALLCPIKKPDSQEAAPPTDQYNSLVKQVFPSGAAQPQEFKDLVEGKLTQKAKVPQKGPGRPSSGGGPLSALMRILTCSKGVAKEPKGGAPDNTI